MPWGLLEEPLLDDETLAMFQSISDETKAKHGHGVWPFDPDAPPIEILVGTVSGGGFMGK